jgi:hypothetical protein
MSPDIEKPRSRMSSSPPSAARKLMPPISLSASSSVSTRRSSISRSVTTVTDCGTSSTSCVPLATEVVVARSEVASLSCLALTAIAGIVVWRAASPAGADAAAVGAAAGCVCVCVCDSACAGIRPKPAASAPSGNSRRAPVSTAGRVDRKRLGLRQRRRTGSSTGVSVGVGALAGGRGLALGM